MLKHILFRVWAVSKQVFIGSLALQTMGLVSAVIVSRALGPAERGVFSSITLIALTASSLGVVGLDVVLARRIASRGAQSALILWWHCIIATAPLTALVYFLSPQVGASWPIVPFLVFSSIFNNIAFQLVLATGDIAQFNRGRIIFSGTYAATALLALTLGANNVNFFIISFTLSSLCASLSFVMCSPFLRIRIRKFPFQDYALNVKDAIGFAASAGLICIASNYVQLVATFIFDKTTLGLVVVALTIVQVSSAVATAISKGLFSVLISNSHHRFTYQSWAITAILGGVTGTLVVIYVLFMGVADKLVPMVFGNGFSPVANSFFWFAVGGVFMCGVIVLDEAIRAERTSSIISIGRVFGMACGTVFWMFFGEGTLNSAGVLFAVFNGAVFMSSYSYLLILNLLSARRQSLKA
jgi:O-antigen/teichoic acid export membrane protein